MYLITVPLHILFFIANFSKPCSKKVSKQEQKLYRTCEKYQQDIHPGHDPSALTNNKDDPKG